MSEDYDRAHAARVAAEAEADGLRRDLAAAGKDRDDARRRAREAAQTIIAVIGADGPQNVEQAAARIVARLEAAEAERDLYRAALADAARGELPRCDECPQAAMRSLPTGDACCDAHATGEGWTDLPHAAALRAAMGGAT